MTYAPLTMFSPAAARYENPSQYAEAARTEAVKQASYLSQMNQFYTQLDESKRQFDVNLTAQKEMFGTEMAFKEKGLSWEQERYREELEYREAELAQQQSQFTQQLDFQQSQLAQQESQFSRQLSAQGEESSFLRDLYNRIYSDERLKIETNTMKRNLSLLKAKVSAITTPQYAKDQYGFNTGRIDPAWKQNFNSWAFGTNQAFSLPTSSGRSSSSSETKSPSTELPSWGGGSFNASAPWGGYGEQVADFRTRAGSGGYI